MSELRDKLTELLSDHLNAIIAKSVIAASARGAGVELDDLRPASAALFLQHLEAGINLYLKDAVSRKACFSKASALINGISDTARDELGNRNLKLQIENEDDIVVARTKGHQLCEAMGFPASLQMKIATVISELARNIVQYAGSGQIDVLVLKGAQLGVEIIAVDKGPGIKDVEGILGGRYRSKTGMGMGLLGTRRLMDEFDIETSPTSGTKVTCRKFAQ